MKEVFTKYSFEFDIQLVSWGKSINYPATFKHGKSNKNSLELYPKRDLFLYSKQHKITQNLTRENIAQDFTVTITYQNLVLRDIGKPHKERLAGCTLRAVHQTRPCFTPISKTGTTAMIFSRFLYDAGLVNIPGRAYKTVDSIHDKSSFWRAAVRGVDVVTSKRRFAFLSMVLMTLPFQNKNISLFRFSVSIITVRTTYFYFL